MVKTRPKQCIIIVLYSLIFCQIQIIILGLLPLMLGQGPLFKGLATVVVVGLSIGTFMTLFVLPAIIAVMVELFGIDLSSAKAEGSEG